MLVMLSNHIKEVDVMKIKWLLLVLLALCALPTLAQETDSNSVSFNGFSFSFPNSVASSVNIAQVAADDPALEQPGGPVVKHTEFTLYNDTLDTQVVDNRTGIISVYNTADFSGYELASTEFANLQTLLAERPDLSAYMVADDGSNANNLPYLPVIGAAQVVRAQAQYVDTPSLQGVRYLTAFRQDVSPFVGDQFQYTFQGLTSDGAYYVSVVIPLITSLFPAEISSSDDPIGEDFEAYLSESIATLSSGMPRDFIPWLTTLDTMVQSISFSGAAPAPELPATTTPAAPEATETTGDQLMGGLAGKTWTLTAFGSADAAQPPVEGSTITIIFTEAGVSGSAGCNSYSGSFTFDNSTLTFGQMIRTLMACEETLMTQEEAFLAALATASSYTISGDQLQISYDSGVLTFSGA